jgi:hypothetical protein
VMLFGLGVCVGALFPTMFIAVCVLYIQHKLRAKEKINA